MYKIKETEIKKLLFKKGLKRSDLANGAGISIETINNWYYRNTKANYKSVKKICNFLNVDKELIFIKEG